MIVHELCMIINSHTHTHTHTRKNLQVGSSNVTQANGNPLFQLVFCNGFSATHLFYYYYLHVLLEILISQVFNNKTKHLQVRISGSDTSCLLKTTRYTRSIEDTLYTVVTENITGTRLSVELFGLLLVVLLILAMSYK